MLPLKVGVAKADITPPVGSKMAGYIQRKRKSKGIHDPLFAKSLYLTDSQSEAVLVVIDSLATDQQLVGLVRDQMQRTGLPSKHLNIAATHTHSGPSGLAALSFGEGYDDDLLELTASQITGTVRQARNRAFEARLKIGSTMIKGLTQNRNDPAQPIDQQLHVLRIEDKDARLRAVLANYPCHPTLLGFNNLLISADWPGAACSIVERVVNSDVIVIMTNGASADVHPMYLSQSLQDLKRMGQVLGGAMLTVLGQLSPLGNMLRAQNSRWGIEIQTHPDYGRQVVRPHVQLQHQRLSLPVKQFLTKKVYDKTIEDLFHQLRLSGLDDRTLTIIAEGFGCVPLERVKSFNNVQYDLLARLTALAGERLERDHALSESRGCQKQEIDVYLLTIDADLGVLFFPGELSNRIGLSIKQRAGLRDLIIVSYANNYIGYIVPREEFPKGGYEVGASHFTDEAEAIVSQGILNLTGERPRRKTGGD